MTVELISHSVALAYVMEHSFSPRNSRMHTRRSETPAVSCIRDRGIAETEIRPHTGYTKNGDSPQGVRADSKGVDS